nr:hemolysin family protein [uncultured Eisenbergiella sp.]
MTSIPKQLLLQVILILLNAFFAAAEIAVVSLNGTKLRKLEEEGDNKAGKLLRLVEEPASFLSTIQVGITLAGFLGSAFAADNFSEYLVKWVYEDLGFRGIPEAALDTMAVVVITIILSYFTLIFGELVPKRIAMQKSLEVAKFSSGVISGVAVIMKPIIWFLSFSTNTILRILHMKTEAEEDSVTEEEIRMMVELGGEKGTIDQEEQEWIQNVFRFDDISVRDAMTREPDVVSFSLEEGDEEILRTIRETGLSRYPVYDEDINDIAGILNARDYLLNRGCAEPKQMQELLREAYFVPDTIHADDLFRDMQTNKVHIAIVIDEYGQTAGIITMEDLLEEIVGNIYDEFDPDQMPEMVRLEENLWRVSGGVAIEELAEELDIDLPEDTDYDTVGGMIYSCLRTIPADGSQFDVQVNGLDIHVEVIEDQRIETALIRKSKSQQVSEHSICGQEQE